jgi:hypothetical protein
MREHVKPLIQGTAQFLPPPRIARCLQRKHHPDNPPTDKAFKSSTPEEGNTTSDTIITQQPARLLVFNLKNAKYYNIYKKKCNFNCNGRN